MERSVKRAQLISKVILSECNSELRQAEYITPNNSMSICSVENRVKILDSHNRRECENILLQDWHRCKAVFAPTYFHNCIKNCLCTEHMPFKYGFIPKHFLNIYLKHKALRNLKIKQNRHTKMGEKHSFLLRQTYGPQELVCASGCLAQHYHRCH